jgi:hypothetical protein
MIKEWLTRKLTVEEAETSHIVKDERLGPSPVVFGFQNARWREFLSCMELGDELWGYSSPPETWAALMGSAGIALVTEGEVVDAIVTRMN